MVGTTIALAIIYVFTNLLGGYMNIVFYILILIFMIIIYFFLSFLFGGIGSLASKSFNKFKENISDKKEKENE